MSDLVPFNKKKTGLLGMDFDDFNHGLDNFFARGWPAFGNFAKDTFRLDVEEKDEEYSIEADLPGVKKEEVKVDLDDGRLTISVEREEKTEEEKKNYVHKERKYSSMSRSVYLDCINEEGIKAKLEEGVLSITIPKAKKTDTSKRIDVE